MSTNQSDSQSGVAEGCASGSRVDLLGQLRHDFKNSMHVILGLAEALQMEVCGPLTDRQSASMRAIEDSGRSLFVQLESFMDLLRMEVEEPELEREEVSVTRCFQDAMQKVQLRKSEEQRRLSLVVGGHPSVEVARDMFAQLLDQLLRGAWEATAHGSEIRLRASADEDQDLLTISVAYEVTGKQPAETLPTALVRRIAELHGGSLEVADEEGARRCISVALPCK